MVRITNAIIKKGDKYLLLKRSPLFRFHRLKWNFPGGKVEPDETLEEACIRQIKKKTNVEVVLGKYLGEIIYDDPQHKKEFLIHLHYFEINSFEGKLRTGPDHTKLGWFTKEEILNKKLHPYAKEFFEEVLEN